MGNSDGKSYEKRPAFQTTGEWLSDREEIDMDRSRFNPTGGNSNDLKAADFLGKHLKLTIERAETVIYNEGADDAHEKTVLYFVGKEKRLVLNATNNETLCKAYTPFDENWEGKEIGLTTKEYTAEGFPPGWIVQALEVEFDDNVPF